MQAILEQWEALSREDLFLFWQEELNLKKELRQHLSAYREIKIENEAQFNFLKHSLAYTGHKDIFFTIVFLNMSSLLVQSALLDGPAELGLGFLRFLPHLIHQEKPSPREIQFLISIYREDFQSYYVEIMPVLKREDCDYLLARTANKSLRQLLKDRQAEIHELFKDKNYGLIDSVNDYPEYPGLYGDKINIIQQTIESLQSSSLENYAKPNEIARIKSILETADLLFMVGLLGDSLALLLTVYQQEQKIFLLEAEDSSSVYKGLNRILRKTLPMYALLAYPTEASQHVLEFYRTFFPGLVADNNSLLYLDLYQILIANRQGNFQHTLIELAQTCHFIDKQEDDKLYKLLHKPLDMSDEDLSYLLKNVQERGLALPHEAYVIMEILRYLELSQVINFSREISTLILNNYLQLYQWIPSPLFINTEIRQQLGIWADDNLKSQVDRILIVRNEYSWAELRDLYTVKPEFFTEDKNRLEKQLVLGSFLGVF